MLWMDFLPPEFWCKLSNSFSIFSVYVVYHRQLTKFCLEISSAKSTSLLGTFSFFYVLTDNGAAKHPTTT